MFQFSMGLTGSQMNNLGKPGLVEVAGNPNDFLPMIDVRLFVQIMRRNKDFVIRSHCCHGHNSPTFDDRETS
jgi:hypothetical protein